jgi:hypothetical protein
METSTWTDGNVTHGNGHMKMETWKWTHGNRHMTMDTWKWTQKHGNMDMDTWTWALGHKHMAPCHMEMDMELL